MKIRRDPVKQAKEEIADILRNHEWLFYEGVELNGNHLMQINYELLADLVYDIKQGRTFGRGAIN